MKIPNLKNIKIGKKELFVILAVMIIAVVSVLVVRNSESANKSKRNSTSFVAMDCYVNVTCYGSKGKDTCKAVKKALTKMEGKDKGKALDKASDIIKEAGVESALMSIGEDVLCVGTRYDGKLWRVGVKNLSTENFEMVGVLEVRDIVIFTAGDKDSKSSVTVLSHSGTAADGLATALVLLGPEAAADYWRENGDASLLDFEMVYVKDDMIFATKGLKNCFSCDDDICWIE